MSNCTVELKVTFRHSFFLPMFHFNNVIVFNQHSILTWSFNRKQSWAWSQFFRQRVTKVSGMSIPSPTVHRIGGGGGGDSRSHVGKFFIKGDNHAGTFVQTLALNPSLARWRGKLA